jgi:hypothetical protein
MIRPGKVGNDVGYSQGNNGKVTAPVLFRWPPALHSPGMNAVTLHSDVSGLE